MPLQKQYPFFHKGRFKNTRNEKSFRFGFSSAFFYIKSLPYALKKACPSYVKNITNHSFKNYYSQPVIVPLGHATVLILYQEHVIITDPIFGSPSCLFKRHTPSIDPETLPRVTHVVLSHNHRDHCDISSLRKLHERNSSLAIHAPLGTKSLLERSGAQTIHEYTWWQHTHISETLSLSFLPAVHWSQHDFSDHNTSLWGSWIIECGPHTIYFGGDTAYGTHFATIKHHFPSIQCALLPIAPCEPSSMKQTHMNAEQSLQAYYDLGRPLFIPIHWGVFRFGSEQLEAPLATLRDHMEQNGEESRLVGTQIGESVILPAALPFSSEQSISVSTTV